MDFLHVRLDTPTSVLGALDDFYGDVLGLERAGGGFRIGATRLGFRPSEAQPFYHFALLLPGDRFEEALAWAKERVALLPDPDSGDSTFRFANWSASACYFHDPASNIVELIAHAGSGENGRRGPFAGREVLGFSELGLVGEAAELAAGLRQEVGLEMWDGSVEGEGRLAFVGEKARTLILAPPGRGWLPTGRPAEPHPVEVVLSGDVDCEARLGPLYVVRRRPS